jgi:hypothetical protein
LSGCRNTGEPFYLGGWHPGSRIGAVIAAIFIMGARTQCKTP